MLQDFPFDDLHGFKDFVTFVGLCAPDDFPIRDNRSKEEQWTLVLAFQGLKEGMSMARREKGDRPGFDRCDKLIDEAYEQFAAGNRKGGFVAIQEVRRILSGVSTQ